MPTRGDDTGAEQRPPARRRLQHRIARYIAFAVIVSLVASAIVLIVLRQGSLRVSMESSARTFAALVALPVVEAANVFSATGGHILRDRMRHWQELNPDLVRLEVVDVAGRVLMVAEGDVVTTVADPSTAPVVGDPELLASIRGLELSAVRVRKGGRSWYRVVAPAVEEWGRHTYSLVATFSYRSLDRELIRSLWLLLGHLAIGLVLAEIVSRVLAAGITRSLDRLHSGVRRIREGRLEERVRIQSNDEIQDLAEAFNSMADELGDTIVRLREANRELETLDQAKADLVANVSHELKTPLTALRGYLELLVEGELGQLSEEALRAVEVCTRNVTRLNVRIEELVMLSKLEKQTGVELPTDKVDIGVLLEGVIETLRLRIEAKELDCTLNLATDTEGIEGVPEQIERVFLNLLDNAVKFTPRGGQVRIASEPLVRDDRRGVLVRVADTGLGIARSERLRIFDRFYQVDPSARRRHGGMGLGLSLVRSIVEAHRGAVWVESAPEHGSTFFVWLPRQPGEDSSGHHYILRRGGSGTLRAIRRSADGSHTEP